MTDPRKSVPVQFPEVVEAAWKTSDFSVSRAGTNVSLLLSASARNRAGTILQVGERGAGAISGSSKSRAGTILQVSTTVSSPEAVPVPY